MTTDRPSNGTEPERSAAPTRPGRRRRLLGVAVAVLAIAALAGGLWVRDQLAAPATRGAEVGFEVEPGWAGARVALELERAGLVKNARVFRYYLQVTGLDRSVGEGLYDLAPTMPAPEIAEALAEGGRPRTVRVVVPEGFRLREVVARLAAAGFGDADALDALTSDPTALGIPFAPEDATAEGYLFPASYDWPVDTTANQALTAMTDRFLDELTEGVRAQLDAAGFRVHEWVTLASMVQAEAADATEMGVIAGVFRNRLDIGMPLQSDPTVAYGLGKRLPELDRSAGDFANDHPWNTYTRPGLPLGPIGNPGHDALHAVLEPERRSPSGALWLYFLHGRDGDDAVFRVNTTLDAHTRDVLRYLR